MPIDEIGVGRASYVGDVARVHAHLSPHPAHLARHFAFSRGLHLTIEVMFADFELAHDLMRVDGRELAQQHDIIPVIARVWFGAFDNDRAVVPRLFLKARNANATNRCRSGCTGNS